MSIARGGKVLALMIAEHASTRLLDAVLTLVLIRTLSVASLGAFVVYQSWVALLLLLFPALENMLYREYGKHRAAGTLGRELAVYRKFNLLKLAVALVLAVACAAVPAAEVDWTTRLAAVALAFALPLSQSLYGLHREPLRFELHQGIVVVLNVLQRAALIAVVYVLARSSHGELLPVTVGALVVYVVFGGAWATAARRLLKGISHERVGLAEALPRMRTAMGEAVLWIHLNGAIMAAVQTLDVYFLSRARFDLTEIAVYSVALKCANFFQFIPLPFAQAFGVYLGRRHGEVDRRLVWLGALGFATLAAVLWFAGVWLAEPLLGFLGKDKFPPDQLARAGEYFRWMLAGVAIQSLSFAHGTYVSSRGNIRGLVMKIFIPWFVFASAGYWAAAQYGPLMAAKLNVAVAAFYTLGQLGYFISKGPLRQRR